jgi:hypothetical protein
MRAQTNAERIKSMAREDKSILFQVKEKFLSHASLQRRLCFLTHDMWFFVVLLLAAVSLVVAAKVKKAPVKALPPSTLPLSMYDLRRGDSEQQVLQIGRPHAIQVSHQRRKAGILKAV